VLGDVAVDQQVTEPPLADASIDEEVLESGRTFRRMWDFYLSYSEAGFRSGYLSVAQLVLARTT
jgi:cyclopropane-fatty-acyl-phospholipid synthase